VIRRRSPVTSEGADLDEVVGEDSVSGRDPGALDAVDPGAVMADLEQFFDSAAGEAEDFDGGPRPERVVFFMTEVAALAGCRVVGPHLFGGLGDRTGQGVARGGECRRRSSRR
jgi:hypothetical protein